MERTVRNCRLCKVPMKTSPFSMCDTCLIESDRIQNYITKYPHVSIEQISKATNVPYEKVKNLANLGVSK